MISYNRNSINRIYEIDDPNRVMLSEGAVAVTVAAGSAIAGLGLFTSSGLLNACVEGAADLGGGGRSLLNEFLGNGRFAITSYEHMKATQLRRFPHLRSLSPEERENTIAELVKKEYKDAYNINVEYRKQFTEDELKKIKNNGTFYSKITNLVESLYNKASGSVFYGISFMVVLSISILVLICTTNGKFGRFLKLLSDAVKSFIDAIKDAFYEIAHGVMTLDFTKIDRAINVFQNFGHNISNIWEELKYENLLSSMVILAASSLMLSFICFCGIISFFINPGNDNVKKRINCFNRINDRY